MSAAPKEKMTAERLLTTMDECVAEFAEAFLPKYTEVARKMVAAITSPGVDDMPKEILDAAFKRFCNGIDGVCSQLEGIIDAEVAKNTTP
mgnify:CR=1 FL=1